MFIESLLVLISRTHCGCAWAPVSYGEPGHEQQFSVEFRATVDEMSQTLAADLRARTAVVPYAALMAPLITFIRAAQMPSMY